MEIGFYFVGALVVLVIGISKSGFSAGIGILAVPLMSNFVEPRTAAAVLLPLIFLMDIVNAYKYRKDWVKEYVLLLLPGALFGVAIGAATFQWLNSEILKISIAVLALWSVGRYLIENIRKTTPVLKQVSSLYCLFIGSLSGLSSFLVHAGGIPLKSYLLSRQMNKTQFVATNSFFFFIVNIIKIASYTLLGQFSSENLSVSLSLLPFAPLGMLIGFYLHSKINQNVFTATAQLFLFICSMKLLWDGFSKIV